MAQVSLERQNEIAQAAAKKLGLGVTDIVGFKVDSNGIPMSIDFSTSKGDFSRSIAPIYGEVLNQQEKNMLLQTRLQENTTNAESLAGVANLLGRNKQPFVSSAGTDRVRAESNANPTFDPSSMRRTNAGLPAGAQNAGGSNGQPLVKFTTDKGEDTRVRIVVPSGPLTNILTSGPVLSPLAPTNGVLFPYTPSIQINHAATYNAENLTHSNYAYQFYQSSNTDTITISAVFACKNGKDASYVVAAQHFFRTVTKMFYGQDPQAGTPPPVLRLEGHGDYQFGAHKDQVGGVPVVITSFGVSLPEDVDYISTEQTDSSTTQTRVPIVQTFSISCIPVYSRKSITGDFGFAKFAKGELLANSSRGGFI